MREICQSGSEGGAELTFVPTPISARGFNPGNASRRVALKGRKVKFVITSEYGLVSHTTRSSGMDLGQDKRTILFDVIASYALSGRSLNGVIPGVKTPG